MGSSDWRLHAIVIDSAEPETAARFWSRLLGLAETHRVEQFIFLEDIVEGTPLTIQQVERVSADKSPIHFDIAPVDFDAFLAHAENLGATKVDTVHNSRYHLVVMADPSGNEFCVNAVTSGAA